MQPDMVMKYGGLKGKVKGPADTTMESMKMEAERKKKAAAMMAASRMANPKTVLGG